MPESHNPPDFDDDLPSYEEAQKVRNTAYNPAFIQSSASHHGSSTTSHEPGSPHTTSTAPSAPLLSTITDHTHSTPLPPAASAPAPGASNLYPSATPAPAPLLQQPYPPHHSPAYYYPQQQQQQQQQHYPQHHHPAVGGPQQYYYQTMPIPQHHQQQAYFPGGFVVPSHRRQIIDHSERRFPVAALFFLFGWICPPLWILGACCCSGSRNRYESWWGKANFIMAVMFIVSSLLYSMMAITVDDWMIGVRVFSLATA